MIPVLLEALIGKLKADLADLRLRHPANKRGEEDFMAPPFVWVGDIPPKEPEAPSSVPCVTLIPISGYQVLEEGSAVASVDLECTIYNPINGDYAAAEVDFANLMAWLNRSLIKCSSTRGDFLAKKFILLPDSQGRLLIWQKYDLQPQPYIQAVMHTTWKYGYLE